MRNPLYSDFSQLKSAISSAKKIDSEIPVWIFGAGNFGRNLCQVMLNRGIKVSGFVETQPKLTRVLNLPVIGWENLAAQNDKIQVALGIFNRAMPFNELTAIAHKYGHPDMLMPWDSYDSFGEDLGWKFWLSTRDFLISGLERLGQVANRLADHESRNTRASV